MSSINSFKFSFSISKLLVPILCELSIKIPMSIGIAEEQSGSVKIHANIKCYYLILRYIERFHATSRPPCWCPYNNRIIITFYCLIHQHGRPVLCLLCLLGLSESALYAQ